MNAVYLYDRDIGTQKLKWRETVEVPFAADNLDYLSTGELLVTGHPHFSSLVSVAWNGTKIVHSPSWVVEISRVSGGTDKLSAKEEIAPYSAYNRASASKGHTMRTLYQSDGSHFQSSSTGTLDTSTNTLFVTGLYEEGILVCHN
jgi:hypothetical protein